MYVYYILKIKIKMDHDIEEIDADGNIIGIGEETKLGRNQNLCHTLQSSSLRKLENCLKKKCFKMLQRI